MGSAETLQKASLPHRSVDAKELEYIAFSGQHEIAHGIFRSIPRESRSLYANKYILNEVVTGGIKKLKKFLAASAEDAAAEEKAFIDETMRFFISSCRDAGTSPRELFLSILRWSEELTQLSLLQEALHYYDDALALGINKYPDLHVQSLLGKAAVLNTMGSFHNAQAILLPLAARPYLITDRNLVPDILFNLGKESLLKGEVAYYKRLLFRGLKYFYTRVENRKLFVEQIVKTYRRSHKVLFDRHVTAAEKLLFFVHRLYFVMQGSRLLTLLRITSVTKALVLGYVYCLNYGIPRSMAGKLTNEQFDKQTRSLSPPRRQHLLVTRAMGGIGDLLMMTPALHELKKKYRQDKIHLAIPRRYFPVFEGNPDVTLLDIEKDQLDSGSYRRWFNFTDCPASRVEARTAPKVTRGRIEIFARALGLGFVTVRRMAKRPRYFVLPEERLFQINFWRANSLTGKKVVGIQLRSDEVYRDYPHMNQLIAQVAKEYHVLVFDAEKIHGYEDKHITKVDSLPMRQAFAVASACDAIIAPDSSFVHLAAAFDIPCVALYGPIDGQVRTKHYPKCKHLDVRKKLGCMPCWRNEQIPCKLTNMRASVCMVDISIDEILNALTEVLQGRTSQ